MNSTSHPAVVNARAHATREESDDWSKAPDGSAVDFLTFARSEGRFAGHFAKDDPTPEILATREDRLDNWRGLQELAGIR